MDIAPHLADLDELRWRTRHEADAKQRDRWRPVLLALEGETTVAITLLSGGDAWALLLWYRLERERGEDGQVLGAESKLVVLSHTTSDAITSIARKYGLGVVRTWVGFAALAAGTRMAWDGQIAQALGLHHDRDEKAYVDLCHPIVCDCIDMADARRLNVAAMEQSNGFSILGGPPPTSRSLGQDGHVRDKDGTLTALLMTELAAWAKERPMQPSPVFFLLVFMSFCLCRIAPDAPRKPCPGPSAAGRGPALSPQTSR